MSNEKKPASKLRDVLSWLLCLAAAVVAALIINRYILLNSNVISGSMENTVMTGDRVFGLRFAYWFHGPERGDVVIFNNVQKGERLMIKRVIGVAGDQVIIIDGRVYVNGEQLDEPYLPEPMRGSYGPYTVPDGCVFLLGDNRNLSLDARSWPNPYIPVEDVLAKAWLIYWKGIRLVR